MCVSSEATLRFTVEELLRFGVASIKARAYLDKSNCGKRWSYSKAGKAELQ